MLQQVSISMSEWLAVIGMVMTVLGGMLATYVGIKIELAKLGIVVSNFKEDIGRMDAKIAVIQDVVDRRHHGTRS